jgi:hypothetical protein
MPEINNTDPLGIPENKRMTSAEFRVVRELLGVSGDWIAQRLGVSPRTVRHWEAGRYRIPDGVRVEVERMERETADAVAAGIAQLVGCPSPSVVTYRSDAEYSAAHPEAGWPAGWHRAVVARIAQDVPGIVIRWAPAKSPGSSGPGS